MTMVKLLAVRPALIKLENAQSASDDRHCARRPGEKRLIVVAVRRGIFQCVWLIMRAKILLLALAFNGSIGPSRHAREIAAVRRA